MISTKGHDKAVENALFLAEVISGIKKYNIRSFGQAMKFLEQVKLPNPIARTALTALLDEALEFQEGKASTKT